LVATPWLDLAFVGPGDLAAGMALKGRNDHLDVQAAMKTRRSHSTKSRHPQRGPHDTRAD
jgi:2-keto-3-deoxy-L-rhamnonate aldolase RhmA